MTWIRLDDGFAHNPKITQVGPAAAMLYVGSLCHCGKNLTDGFIARADVFLLAAVSAPTKLAKRLVDVGLWTVVPGGYQIPDYLDYNPSRAQVTLDRERRSKAGAKGAHSRWHGESHSASHSRSHSESDGSVDSGMHGGMHSTVPIPLLGTNAAAGSKTDAREQQPLHGLLDQLAQRGIDVTLYGLTPDVTDVILQLMEKHTATRLADSAYAQYQPDNPAGSILAFLRGWQELPEPSRPRLALPRCPHGQIHDGRCEQCPAADIAQ